jgi:hypothetical protein
MVKSEISKPGDDQENGFERRGSLFGLGFLPNIFKKEETNENAQVSIPIINAAK